MEVKTLPNGNFVRDHIGFRSNEMSDTYDLFRKSDVSILDVAHDVRRHLNESSDSDADCAKFTRLIGNLKVAAGHPNAGDSDNDHDDGSLGTAFYRTTDHPAREYTKLHNKYDSIPTMKLSEARPKDYRWLVDERVIEEGTEIVVPLIEGEAISPAVTSNDETGATNTFDEAKQLVEEYMDHNFTVVEVDESEVPMEDDREESSDNSQSSGGDSDELAWNDPQQVDGVGPALAENIEDAGWELRPTEEATNIKFDFESAGGDSKGNGGYEMIEVREKYIEVREDVSEMDRNIIEARLKSNTNLQEAVALIQEYEAEDDGFVFGND
jgi:hypothetical protein